MTEKTCSEKIESVLINLGITQSELARRLGLDQSLISRYLSGTQMPGVLGCLMLAGMSDNSDDRDYWLRESGLTSGQLNLISSAINDPSPKSAKIMTYRDRALIKWFQSRSGDPLEESIKATVDILVSR